MNCCEVAELLGDSPRTVEYWVRRFEQNGLAGLQEGDRPGRPGRLDAVTQRIDPGGTKRIGPGSLTSQQVGGDRYIYRIHSPR